MNDAFRRLIEKVASSGGRGLAVPCESREQADRLRDRYYYERRKLRGGSAGGDLLKKAELVSARVEESEDGCLVVFEARRDMLEELLGGVLGDRIPA